MGQFSVTIYGATGSVLSDIQQSYAFKRARNWLQDHNYTREYDQKIWFADDADRQDI